MYSMGNTRRHEVWIGVYLFISTESDRLPPKFKVPTCWTTWLKTSSQFIIIIIIEVFQLEYVERDSNSKLHRSLLRRHKMEKDKWQKCSVQVLKDSFFLSAFHTRFSVKDQQDKWRWRHARLHLWIQVVVDSSHFATLKTNRRQVWARFPRQKPSFVRDI